MILLGIDCGTQSTKTVALDWETGQILASAQKAYGFAKTDQPGAMEQHPEDWDAAMRSTVTEVLAHLGSRKSEVAGIGVSGQQHGLVVLDESGAVVRPAKLWCDTSTAPQCEALTRELGGTEAVVGHVGNAMLPGYTAPKIRWLAENEPHNWEKTRLVLLPHDFLNLQLTGSPSMEYGDASGTALLDVRSRTWSEPVCQAVAPHLPSRLPTLRSSAQPAGRLKNDLAAEWGLPEGVVVSAGGGDNMMGAIGTGNVSPGVVTASLGTSGTLYAYSDVPVIDPRGEVAAFCDSTDAWLPLVCTMNVTLVTELTRSVFGWSHAEVDERIAAIEVGAGGLRVLPYLVGERTPNLPRGGGVLAGLRPENFTPAHLARAMTEAVTLGLGYGIGRLRDLGIHPTEIRLTGGGSNSPAWRQICADVFGVPVVTLQSGEGAALGAAIQAGWSVQRESGDESSLSSITDRLVKLDESTRAVPSPQAVDAYAAQLAETDRLRATLHTAGWI